MDSIMYFDSLDISKYCFDKCFLRFERKLYIKKIDCDAIPFGGKIISSRCELFLRSFTIYHDDKESIIADPSIDIKPPNKDTNFSSKNSILLKDLKISNNIFQYQKEEMIKEANNGDMKNNNSRIKSENKQIILPLKLLINSNDDVINYVEDEKNREEYFEINSKRMRQEIKKHHEEEFRNKIKIDMKKYSNQINNYQYTNDHNGGFIFINKPRIENLPKLDSLSHFHVDKSNNENKIRQNLTIKQFNPQKDETQTSLYQYMNANPSIEKIDVDNTLYNENNMFKLSDGVSLLEIGLNKRHHFPNQTNLPSNNANLNLKGRQFPNKNHGKNENNEFQKPLQSQNSGKEKRDIQDSKQENYQNFMVDSQDKDESSKFFFPTNIPIKTTFQQKRKSDLIGKINKLSFRQARNDETKISLDEIQLKLNLPINLKSSRIKKVSSIDDKNHNKMIISSTMEFLNGKLFSELNSDQKLLKKPSLKNLPKLKILSIGLNKKSSRDRKLISYFNLKRK